MHAPTEQEYIFFVHTQDKTASGYPLIGLSSATTLDEERLEIIASLYQRYAPYSVQCHRKSDNQRTSIGLIGSPVSINALPDSDTATVEYRVNGRGTSIYVEVPQDEFAYIFFHDPMTGQTATLHSFDLLLEKSLQAKAALLNQGFSNLRRSCQKNPFDHGPQPQ